MGSREDVTDTTLSDLLSGLAKDPKARVAWLEVDTARTAAKLLRDARRRSGLRQVDLERLLGVSQARISQVESGRVDDMPSLDFMVRFLDACGQELVLSTRDATQSRSTEEMVGVDPVLLRRVDDVDLSAGTVNQLRNDNITYVGELVQKSESDLLHAPAFGRKSLDEIKAALASMGLHLGMELPVWPSDPAAYLDVAAAQKRHGSE
ncbi:DNA-directed RNA polymerase subunit alpha C-terminal domain-containing protein [Astrobacterium formosum]|uniref:helix-turn-helix domain-containing protein n=1 Tax=Astrobacterium formosum TaxID=3069710 RepID=UPI003F4FAD33